jgi:hypothetical protein
MTAPGENPDCGDEDRDAMTSRLMTARILGCTLVVGFAALAPASALAGRNSDHPGITSQGRAGGHTTALLPAPVQASQGQRRGGGESQSSGPQTAPIVTTPHGAQTAEGVVQSVSATTVTLRQLDGTTVAIPVDRQTAVFVDGHPGRIGDASPGYVVVATWASGAPASVLLFYSAS